ncbi:hypothetical protein [Rhodoflexus caldus]|uniref:hypothetical protein n=1 Tax=Rhodoflexus caldus TaxID=2891236 RepID=UPI00202A1C24|nr:hypothetical protein [Rhodoflexus caldus]
MKTPTKEQKQAFELACKKYHEANPTDARIDYDTYTWFKGSNVVVKAIDFHPRTILPKACNKIIYYKDLLAEPV